MKKLVFMFVACAAISFASCNGTQKPAEGNADSTDTVQCDSACTDSAAQDSTVAVEEAPATEVADSAAAQ